MMVKGMQGRGGAYNGRRNYVQQPSRVGVMKLHYCCASARNAILCNGAHFNTM